MSAVCIFQFVSYADCMVFHCKNRHNANFGLGDICAVFLIGDQHLLHVCHVFAFII